MTDPTRDLLISLASHMAYMQGQLEARHQLDDPEDYYWFRESVALRQKVADALADEPAVPAPPAALPEGYIDPEHSGDDRALLETYYAACQAEGGTADDITLRGLRAVLARWGTPAPAPPADGEVAELVAWLRERGQERETLHLPGTKISNELRTAPFLLTRAAELLQRQALVPVAVSERLPGPEDCLPWPGEPDETHWCWAFSKGPLDDDSWERRPVTSLTTYKPMHSYWLPAHALPVPEASE